MESTKRKDGVDDPSSASDPSSDAVTAMHEDKDEAIATKLSEVVAMESTKRKDGVDDPSSASNPSSDAVESQCKRLP